jgi:hypothetical protein
MTLDWSCISNVSQEIRSSWRVSKHIRVEDWPNSPDSLNGTGAIASVNAPNANFQWSGSAAFDFNQGRIFFLDIYDLSNATTPKFRSHYFNLTDAPPKPPTPNPSPNVTCSNEPCLHRNNAVAIGGGVGGGVGGTLLLTGIAFVLRRYLKKKKEIHEQQYLAAEKSDLGQAYPIDPHNAASSPVSQAPVELPGSSKYPELA